MPLATLDWDSTRSIASFLLSREVARLITTSLRYTLCRARDPETGFPLLYTRSHLLERLDFLYTHEDCADEMIVRLLKDHRLGDCQDPSEPMLDYLTQMSGEYPETFHRLLTHGYRPLREFGSLGLYITEILTSATSMLIHRALSPTLSIEIEEPVKSILQHCYEHEYISRQILHSTIRLHFHERRELGQFDVLDRITGFASLYPNPICTDEYEMETLLLFLRGSCEESWASEYTDHLYKLLHLNTSSESIATLFSSYCCLKPFLDYPTVFLWFFERLDQLGMPSDAVMGDILVDICCTSSSTRFIGTEVDEYIDLCVTYDVEFTSQSVNNALFELCNRFGNPLESESSDFQDLFDDLTDSIVSLLNTKMFTVGGIQTLKFHYNMRKVPRLCRLFLDVGIRCNIFDGFLMHFVGSSDPESTDRLYQLVTSGLCSEHAIMAAASVSVQTMCKENIIILLDFLDDPFKAGVDTPGQLQYYCKEFFIEALDMYDFRKDNGDALLALDPHTHTVQEYADLLEEIRGRMSPTAVDTLVCARLECGCRPCFEVFQLFMNPENDHLPSQRVLDRIAWLCELDYSKDFVNCFLNFASLSYHGLFKASTQEHSFIRDTVGVSLQYHEFTSSKPRG